jgi:hypothetical protein
MATARSFSSLRTLFPFERVWVNAAVLLLALLLLSVLGGVPRA